MKKFKSKICLYGKVRRCASRSPHTSSSPARAHFCQLRAAAARPLAPSTLQECPYGSKCFFAHSPDELLEVRAAARLQLLGAAAPPHPPHIPPPPLARTRLCLSLSLCAGQV